MKKLLPILAIALLFACQEGQDIAPQEVLETDEMEMVEEALFTCIIECYEELDLELELLSAIDQEGSTALNE